MSDTVGENTLVPTRLVLGLAPGFPIIGTEIPTQKERMEVFSNAQVEFSAIIAERKMMATLTRNIPPGADRLL